MIEPGHAQYVVHILCFFGLFALQIGFVACGCQDVLKQNDVEYRRWSFGGNV